MHVLPLNYKKIKKVENENRTHTLGITTQCANHYTTPIPIFYYKIINLYNFLHSIGLEPITNDLKGHCSTKLS